LRTFDKKFGVMEWQTQLVPTYGWYNHKHEAYVVGDKIDTSGPVTLNSPMGTKADPLAQIHPFKTHRAKQPYDKEQKILATPKWFEVSGAISIGTRRSRGYGCRETQVPGNTALLKPAW